MGKRIVIALGGNALGTSLPEQMKAVKITEKAIVDLIEQGHEVAIAHGNGPQVGMIQNAMTQLVRSDPDRYVPCPLSVCVAMSQGYIGYDLQNALREEMLDRGISKGVATVLTQVEVDPGDPAFDHPTKPIGAFMTKEEADRLVRERQRQCGGNLCHGPDHSRRGQGRLRSLRGKDHLFHQQQGLEQGLCLCVGRRRQMASGSLARHGSYLL